MYFTDIFVRKPVLATVVSLAILVIGLRSLFSLPVLQYPQTQNAVVTVTTQYYGADPKTVAGFVTTPLEHAIAQANGIDYMTSTSVTGTSTITANLRLNFDTGRALTEINTKINSVVNQLPTGVLLPSVSVTVGQTIDAMYLGFTSDILTAGQVTDYIMRVVQPKIQALPGVQLAELLGDKTFAMRVWLDPDRLAAHGLTPGDIAQALSGNDYITGLGSTKGQMVKVNLTATTALHSLEEFRNLVVAKIGSANVRLADIANVSLGSETYASSVSFNGKGAVYVGIQIAPGANLLDVANQVRTIFPDIQKALPRGLEATIAYDSTEFVSDSISEVIETLIEALLIVTGVVFMFLGSWRAALIPIIAIPLSLIGTFALLLALGFSINLLTLLALVLAIGLVVDDAIIVVENVNRHLSEGLTPRDAAICAARELAGPIAAMTLVLIAVYVPIGVQGGLTGALFLEFAFTLAGAVTVSGVIALTLSPVSCAYMLKQREPGKTTLEERIVDAIEETSESLRRRYRRALDQSLDQTPVSLAFGAIILGSIYFLYTNAKSELAPNEDQGIIVGQLTSAPDATLQQKMLYGGEVEKALISLPQTRNVFHFLMSPDMIGAVLKPSHERDKSADVLQSEIQGAFDKIAGQRVVAFQPPPLPGASGLPIQFVLQSTESFERLDIVAKKLLREAMATGQFAFLDKDLKIDQPQAVLELDRELSAQLGVRMNDVGGGLTAALSGGYINYFGLDGRSYKVIPQVDQRFRLNPDQILDTYFRTGSGGLVSVATVAHFRQEVAPETINHFQQANAVTLSGVAAPGVVEGDALATLREIAQKNTPQGYMIDYAGPSRQFVKETSGFALTFGFAIITIFLALSALFESYRDPLIVLVSVPMSIAGALIFVMLGVGDASNNIYTQVGLVTLMGLISKHGILIVEFANELQHEGASKREAILEAASIRLRPILMTTVAMVLGVLPLVFAAGAGAASRFNIGLVIVTGLSIGTLFTLFVLPAYYLLFAADHRAAAGEDRETSPGAT
jgi:multidrug efflux pump